jgi:hypothetical protein
MASEVGADIPADEVLYKDVFSWKLFLVDTEQAAWWMTGTQGFYLPPEALSPMGGYKQIDFASLPEPKNS